MLVSIAFLFLVLLTAFLVLPTKLILVTLKDNKGLVQLITFQCLGRLLEGTFKFSRVKGMFTLRVLSSSVWNIDLERGEDGPGEGVDLWAILRDIDLLQAFLRSVQRLLQDTLKTISFEGFFCHLRVGLPDPAQTGIMVGIFHTITGQIRSKYPRTEVDITMEPVWGMAKLEVFARGTLHFRLINWIIPLIRFFLDGSVRKFLRLIGKKV